MRAQDEAIVRAARELTVGNILGGDRHQPASSRRRRGVLDETRGGRDWCSKKVWRSRKGMGNRVNADRWNIESCPSRHLGWWAGLDSCRTVPYRTVPHPYRGRTVGVGYARRSRGTSVAQLLCARNNSRSVLQSKVVIYVGMGRSQVACGTERWTTPGWNWRSERGPVLVFCSLCVHVCSRAGAGAGVGWAPCLCCFLLHRKLALLWRPWVGKSEG